VLRHRPVDIIHAHNVEAPAAAWLGMKLARKRVPLIFNLHAVMADELPTYVDSAEWAWRCAGGVLDRIGPALADGCVAISTHAEQWLRANGARRVEVVPPGIDPRSLQGANGDRARRRWDLRGPWVVYAGNTDGYQDLDLLFGAMTRVPEARLLVVTGSDPGVPRTLAQRAGLQTSRLRVIHSSSFDDARDALAMATVAALPRRVCAGFPIKLLNHMGLGVPTVASRGSANDLPGVVAVDHNPAAMAHALRHLVSSPRHAAALGEAARAHVLSELTWERSAARIEVFYRTLIDGVTPPLESS
jgi:glycosyltransferase involved in cell wall biosynthesis